MEDFMERKMAELNKKKKAQVNPAQQEELRKKAEQQEALRQQEEAKKQEALRQQEEAKKQEALRQQEEEAKKQEALRQQEEAKKQEALRQQEEAKKREALRQQEEAKKREALRQQEEAKKQEALRQQEEAKKQEALRQQEEERIDVPELIFIVPYRDREQHQEFFKNHMKTILEDYDQTKYKIHYIHQIDERSFNRGAMKNIGFLMVKNKYPAHYKDITLVFNDVDTMPYVKNFINYYTQEGVVKHFYGYKFALGGIVSIKAGDFEKTGGFPNFWAWGYEDNLLKKRVERVGLKLDYNEFYDIHNKNILQMKDGFHRIISRKEHDAYVGNTNSSFYSISDLEYTINEENGFVNVTKFDVDNKYNKAELMDYDSRNGNTPFSKRRKGGMKMNLLK